MIKYSSLWNSCSIKQSD